MGRIVTVGGPSAGTTTWQTIVRSGIEESRFVFIVPSDSDGVRWEVQQITSMGMLAHTLWVMPPADAFPSGEREWELGRTGLAPLGVQLPPFQREGAFVILDGQGSVRKLVPFGALWNGALTELLTQESRAPSK